MTPKPLAAEALQAVLFLGGREENAGSAMTLEVLDIALVFQGRGLGLEGAQVSALTGLGVDFAEFIGV
jgi:hypothetical protein